MRHWHLLVPGLALMALLAMACGPAATPTKAPAATTAPDAKPTSAAPQASPAVSTPAPKAAEPKPPVVLGSVLSLTGPAGSTGLPIKRGMDLAVDEINAKGGIDGRKIEIIYEDDGGEPGKATSATTKLIQKDKVVAVIGAAVTATSVAAAQVANAEKVVLFSPTFTGDQLTAPGSGMDYVFRIGLPDRFTIGKLAQYGARNYSKIGIFTDSGPAGQSIAPIATKALTDAGKPPIGSQTYDMRSPDMTPQLLNLQKAGAEALIIQGLPPDAVTIMKNMKQIGYEPQILGHLAFTDPLVRTKDGVIAADIADRDKPEFKTFLAAFTKKYGGDVNSSLWTSPVGGYDAVYVMAEGLKKAGFDRDKLKQGLEGIRDMPAVSGYATNKISFGPNQHDGNLADSVVLVQVKGKDLVKVN